MPFPSYQGTQAVIRTMMETLSDDRRQAHLLTYASSGYRVDPAFHLHRIGDFPRHRSLRSGPSLAKAALDLRLLVSLRRLENRVAPEVIVAHHVEAAAAAVVASRLPVIFFAHTDLGAELPLYPIGLPPAILRRAGEGLDGWILRRAGAVATISPRLRDRLIRRTAGGATGTGRIRPVEVVYVPPPWPVADPITAAERERVRRSLGLAPEAKVWLYSGNLDRYQGWEKAVRALRVALKEEPESFLLFATESDTAPLLAEARAAGILSRLRITGLAGEAARRRAHAASDVAVIPRDAEGGLPVKLLDALSRGVPTVVMKKGAAGLPLEGVAVVTGEATVGALADDVVRLCRE
jgi:glycosyltransferase involved in cell wall biosynthesis